MALAATSAAPSVNWRRADGTMRPVTVTAINTLDDILSTHGTADTHANASSLIRDPNLVPSMDDLWSHSASIPLQRIRPQLSHTAQGIQNATYLPSYHPPPPMQQQYSQPPLPPESPASPSSPVSSDFHVFPDSPNSIPPPIFPLSEPGQEIPVYYYQTLAESLRDTSDGLLGVPNTWVQRNS